MAEPAMLPHQANFVFRGSPEAAMQAGAAFEVPLPTQPCRAACADGRAALWQGPDEWLLLASAEDEPDIAAAIAAALGDTPHALVRVSHRNTMLELAGPDAADMLNAGCPLDLSAAAFPPGACTRTVLAKAPILLWRTEVNTFRLGAWRSFVPYVRDFLTQAGLGL